MSKLTKYQNSSIAESDKIGNIFKRVKSLITNLSNRVDSIESGSFDTSNLVDKTTNQTIGGVKTFTLSPVVPTPTTNMQAATKKYVDDNVGAGVDTSNFVDKTTAQTIGGVKTFSSNPISTAIQLNAVNALTRKDYVDTQLVTKADQSDLVTEISNRQNADISLQTQITSNTGRIVTIEGNISTLQTNLALKANDADVVKITGNQSIDGVKTFISSPVVPTPTTNMQAATKKYVDDEIINAISGGEIDLSGFVDTTTNQTIAGVKTFSSNPISTAIQLNAVNALTRKDYVDTQLGTKADQNDLTNLTIRVTNLEDLTVFEEHMDTNPII